MLGETKRNLSPEEKRFFYLSVFTVALLLGSVLPQHTLARTWYIKADGTGDAPTIQAGVDSAAVGDTVLVGAGTYTDTTYVAIYTVPVPVNVHLYKNISLIGETAPPGVVISGVYSAAAIYVHDVDSTALIESFRIRREDPYIQCILDAASKTAPDVTLQAGSGINCRRASVQIVGNELVDLGYGVRIEGSSPSIRNNHFLRTVAGVSATGETTVEIADNYFETFYVAISGSECSARIVGNEIQGNTNSCEGISFLDAVLYVSHNVIRNTQYNGLSLASNQAVSRAIIEHNWIEGVSWDALYLSYCNQTSVRWNTFVWNNIAFDIQGSSDVIIENNTVDGAGIGMLVDLDSNSAIRGNIINRATDGITCVGGGNPTVECNDVFEATRRYSGCPDQTGLNGNIALDPEFCGIDNSGNYFLQSDSPCAPANHPDGYNCGLIGAHEVNCGKVDAAQKSWGSIKSLYREEESHDR